MTGQRDDEPHRLDVPAGSGEPATDGDVLELGGRRLPTLPWRPPKIGKAAVLLAAAGLLVGLAAGYVAGDRHGREGAPSARASAVPAPAVGGPTLGQSGNQCSAQIGTSLQLGVQVTNGSSTALTVGPIRAILPMGMLRVTSEGWGPCGELTAVNDVADRFLPAGASTWFTVTVTVLVKCPGALPVQFMVGYQQHGKLAFVQLPGFVDLGHVPYAGCPTG